MRAEVEATRSMRWIFFTRPQLCAASVPAVERNVECWQRRERFAIDPPRRGEILPPSQHGIWIMRGILLWALGIPIPIIILLYLFHVL